MANDTAKTITTNLLPVQGTFEPLPPYNIISFIGPGGTPFFAPANPNIDGATITNSTINSTTIGATTPSTAAFTTATMTNQPVGNLDLCNKTYVDAAIVGISWKQPVRTATTANITLSGNQTIDAVAVTAGDRVLVKDQTDDYENGIYVVGTPWTRSPDANTWDELVSAMVFVESGGQSGSAFYCPIQPGGTLGVTPITWSNFSVAGTYFAGTGLSLAANTFSITNTGVSAATYGSASAVPTIAVNAQGQITSATATPIAIAATAITSGTIDSGRLSGTYNIDISGNAATATSATTAGSASSATTATNLAGGASGNVPYQTGAGATSFLATGSNGQVLTLASGVPSWATPTTGTVTSVGGTGTVSGISLSGTVTSSGDLTLGGALDLSAPPVIGNTTPNSATFTTVNATTFDTNVAAAGVTLAGTTLAADGTDANINILIDPKGTGGVGIGGSPSGVVAGVTITSKFCVKDEGSGVLGGFVHANNTTAASPAVIYACRSRGTLAVPTVVQNNDSLASFIAAGFDGTDLALAARIDVEVDGTPGSNDMPARMVFKTTPDGSQTPTEAMRIGSNQTVTIGTAALTTATVSNDLNLTGTLSLNGSSGTAGYVLTSNGASDPTWEAASAGLTITDDTTTNATRYLTFTDATTGTETGLDVSSTKLTYNPSTGTLASTVFATNTVNEGTSGSGVTVDGVLLKDSGVNGLTVGLGAGSVSTNTAVGVSALAANTTGANNTAVGYQALDVNTTGIRNTAVGSASLGANTTGAGNTAVGFNAMLANTTGSDNCAFGAQNDTFAPLASNTSGNKNAAFGCGALYSNTTGSNNVAMGHNALYSNTTAGNLTAVGFLALTSNTTGTTNTGVGFYALRANTTGSSNTALGYEALNVNTTGNDNTAVGYRALDACTTASNNTCVGNNAGGAITTGGINHCFGLNAGSNITTGAANICVGNAETAANNNDFSIVIGTVSGSPAVGKGSSTGFINPNGGGVYNGGNTTTWTTTSDQRLKKNIVDNTEGLEKITGIRVRNFEYRLPEEVDPELKPSDAIKKEGVQLGVIAQELAEVCPDCVTEQSTGVLSVDTDEIFWHMVNAIKELKTELDSVKAELVTLKGN